MTITLITPELHTELETIAKENPELVFDNVGFEYLSREVKEEKAEQIARISEILKEHVKGFSKFFNFKPCKKRGLTLRFDYAWDQRFVGVGYLPLDHLRDGFPEGEKSQA